MNRCFFDTSALVKIYHREAGSDICLAYYVNQSKSLAISELSCVEFHSAIIRKEAGKALGSDASKAVLQRFRYDCGSRYEVLFIASFVYQQACKLLSQYAGTHGLRTLDSLQVATFLAYCEKSRDSFICSDVKLSAVVQAEDIQCVFAG